jgi:predicted RNA-binding protein with PIN domain
LLERSDLAQIALRYDPDMRWLIDGYNVIRRSAHLASAERESLESGRRELCRLLGHAARARGDQFTVVFDGAGSGGSMGGGDVRVIFSSARESADRVLARLAAQGGAVVSNDREVRRAAIRSGAIPVTTDEFLSRLERDEPDVSGGDPDSRDADDDVRSPKKGNPRRLGKKARAAARVLGRLSPPGPR